MAGKGKAKKKEFFISMKDEEDFLKYYNENNKKLLGNYNYNQHKMIIINKKY